MNMYNEYESSRQLFIIKMIFIRSGQNKYKWKEILTQEYVVHNKVISHVDKNYNQKSIHICST